MQTPLVRVTLVQARPVQAPLVRAYRAILAPEACLVRAAILQNCPPKKILTTLPALQARSQVLLVARLAHFVACNPELT